MDLANLTHSELLIFASEAKASGDESLFEEIHEEFKRRIRLEKEK